MITTHNNSLMERSAYERLKYLARTRSLFVIILATLAFVAASIGVYTYARNKLTIQSEVADILQSARPIAQSILDNLQTIRSLVSDANIITESNKNNALEYTADAQRSINALISNINTDPLSKRYLTIDNIRLSERTRFDIVQAQAYISNGPNFPRKSEVDMLFAGMSKNSISLTDTMYRAAAVYSGRNITTNNWDLHLFSFSAPAFAQAASAPTPPNRLTQDDAKLYVMIAVFILLAITFLTSIVAVFLTKEETILKFALDTVKTLLGFFVGVATAFLGLPAAH